MERLTAVLQQNEMFQHPPISTPDQEPFFEETQIVETTYVVSRLSKAEKKSLKAERLKEKRRFNTLQYKARKKERAKNNPQPADSTSAAPILRKSDINDKMKKALECGLNVCIDFAFDQEHDERERSSLAKQISLSYGIIKKASSPLHIHLSSFVRDSPLHQKLQDQGIRNWKVDIHDSPAWDIFPRNSLVFLSPDAEIPIDFLDTNKVYVIGGIVDRSVRKDRMHMKAIEQGVECRRFPIQELIPNRVNHILNVDHCVNILQLMMEENHGSWSAVLADIVPKRKQQNKSSQYGDDHN